MTFLNYDNFKFIRKYKNPLEFSPIQRFNFNRLTKFCIIHHVFMIN